MACVPLAYKKQMKHLHLWLRLQSIKWNLEAKDLYVQITLFY